MDVRRGTARFRRGCPGLLCIGAVACFLALVPTAYAAKKALTDQGITDAVEDEFLYDPAIWPRNIYISTHNGVVTLNGVTDNVLEKDRAAKIARTVKGVRAVVDDIKVRPAYLRTRETLKNDVIEGLASDPATDAYKLSVEADNDGRVTLKGTVDSWQEKHLAGIVAKGTIGVTAVDNRIKITADKDNNRPAGQIKAEIKQRLFWDVLVNSGYIHVAVDGHTVRLTGTVGSASERQRARTLAYVTGVSRVDTSGLKIQDWAKDRNLRNPGYVAKSDGDVTKAVKDAFLYDPRVNPFKVAVETDSGTVTLRGEVDNMAAKRSAGQDARNTVGVSRVVNRIKVRPIARISDGELANRVQAALMRDPYIDDYRISVVVKNRVAKLYGTVDTYFEKTQADYVAERVKGVAEVVNDLVVRHNHRPLSYDPYVDPYPPYLYSWYDYAPAPSYRSDREIRKDIEDQLWWSPFVDSDDIHVSVVGGQATLTGIVDSPSQRRAATENAWEGGATWVVNDLTVKNTGQG